MSDLYKEDGERYFAASNTKDGFVSYFDDVFSDADCDRVYILKGGPGCGKSTFMKKLGALAEEAGLSAEYFHCSSDPLSLDGLIIKELKTCVVDGTSPHVVEARLPGAREIIIDLGKGWDVNALYDRKNDIEKLLVQKKKCYLECYNFLHAKSVMDSLVYNLIFPHILFDKLDKSALRLSKSLFRNNKYTNDASHKVRITQAVSCQGKVRLFTFENKADFCVFLKEPFCSCKLASMFLSTVYEYAKRAGAEVIVSYNPQIKGEIDALYFPEISTSISAYDENQVFSCDRTGKKCRIINCMRFLDTKALCSVNPLRRFYCRLSENLEKDALESLAKAGKAHAETEKIYRSCTCYRTVENIGDEYFEKILNMKMPHQ